MTSIRYPTSQDGNYTGYFLNDTGLPKSNPKRRAQVWHAWGTGKDKPGGFLGLWKEFFEANRIPPESNQLNGQNWRKLNREDRKTLLRGDNTQLFPYCGTCQANPICAERTCPKLATCGAHVYDDTMWTTHDVNKCLIIPTCTDHNKAPNSNPHNYPLLEEALDPKQYETKPGIPPSQVKLKKTQEPRPGMEVKPNTLAMNHIITNCESKHADAYGNQQGGKGGCN